AVLPPHHPSADATHRRRQHARAVDHGRIDDLAMSGALALPQRRQDADDEKHLATEEAAYEIQWRDGTFACAADRVQHAVERDVIDVVAGLLAARTSLAPAGHPGVDQLFVDLGAVLRPQSEALGDAGTEALDQHVGLGNEPQYQFAVFFALEVGRDGAPV